MSRCQATAKTTGERCKNEAGEDGYCGIESHGPDASENCREEDPVEKPHDWDRVVDAASVIVIGGTQAEAAEISGAGERTIREWKRCSWWQDAIDEAIEDRLTEIGRFALNTVREAMKDGKDLRLAWEIVQRMIGAAPDDTQSVDVTSDGDKVKSAPVVFMPDNGKREGDSDE